MPVTIPCIHCKEPMKTGENITNPIHQACKAKVKRIAKEMDALFASVSRRNQ